jgi:signal transduction histidine kinase
MSEESIVALTAEIDKYFAEADALKYGDHQQLLSIAQSAGIQAQKLGDFRRYAQALTHQAWAYVNLNQYELSLIHSLEVLILARTQGFVEVEARITGIIGANFFRCGIRQEAMYLYERQLALGEQLQNNEIQAMALNDLANVKMEAQDTEAGIELLRRALKLMPRYTHGGLDYSIVHLNLAIASINTRRYDEAVKHAQQVLARAGEAPKLICDAYLCMAEVGLGRDDLQQAYDFVERARVCVETAVPPFYSDNLEQVNAELLTREERYREAAQVWERMYEMAIQNQELEFAVSALNHAKDTYERINDLTGLLSAYKRLSEDIPRLQKQGDDLRFTVLRMVFAMDKAAMQTELRLTQQKKAVLERLSHEFRTPLAIIQSSTESLHRYSDRMTREQRQERLQQITEQVQLMTLLLEDILELLRLDENAQPSVNRTPFRLDELAQEAIRELERYRMSSARVQIQTQPDAGIIYGARKALTMALAHLLTNALKFSQREVKLNLSVVEGVLIMEVADQGIGIRKDEQEEVFKLLVRGSNLDEVNGAGLGLAIVVKLVEQLRGTVDLKSSEGEGTTVTLRVPMS